jgi:hypothetical protein
MYFIFHALFCHGANPTKPPCHARIHAVFHAAKRRQNVLVAAIPAKKKTITYCSKTPPCFQVFFIGLL